MTTRPLAQGEVGMHAFVLTPNAVDTVTFVEDLQLVTIISDGADAVYYTLDGSAPTVGGKNCYVIPAGGGADTREPKAPSTTVKLISAGAPTLSVQTGI